MPVGVITLHYLTAGETGATGISRGDTRVWTTRAEEGLGEAMGEESFTNIFGASKKIGVTHLLCCQGATQQVDRVIMADDAPLIGSCLQECSIHKDMVAETPGKDKLRDNTIP